MRHFVSSMKSWNPNYSDPEQWVLWLLYMVIWSTNYYGYNDHGTYRLVHAELNYFLQPLATLHSLVMDLVSPPAKQADSQWDEHRKYFHYIGPAGCYCGLTLWFACRISPTNDFINLSEVNSWLSIFVTTQPLVVSNQPWFQPLLSASYIINYCHLSGGHPHHLSIVNQLTVQPLSK